jgi:hypothetical protein
MPITLIAVLDFSAIACSLSLAALIHDGSDFGVADVA